MHCPLRAEAMCTPAQYNPSGKILYIWVDRGLLSL